GGRRTKQIHRSHAAPLAFSERMEESNAWRNPVDLQALLEDAFTCLPEALAEGADRRGSWDGRRAVVTATLDAEASDMVEALLEALREGATEVELASAVAFAAATRIA